MGNAFCVGKRRGNVTDYRRPLVAGFAIAAGTLIGLVVLGGSSVEDGLVGAISAFVVMIVLRSYF